MKNDSIHFLKCGLAYSAVVTLLLFLTCCSNHSSYTPQLNAVDSMLERGDLAVAKAALDSLSASRSDMSRSQLMHLQMLETSYKNKNYEYIGGDTVMKDVAEYYDNHGSMRQQMESYYLLGCVYRDRQSPLMALDCYKKAIDKADTAKLTVPDYRLLMCIHGQTSGIYTVQKLPDRNLEELKLVNKYAKLCKDTLYMLYSYYSRSSVLYSMGCTDSVISICYKSNKLFRKYGYEKEAHSLWLPAIYILLERKDYSKAKELIDLFENKSGLVDRDGNVSSGYEEFYSYKGMYYLGVSRLDSAEYYFRKLLPFVDKKDNFNKAQFAYRGLFSVYERKGNADSIAKYARAWCEANDSSVISLSTEKIQHIRSMYDYSAYERLAQKKAEEARVSKYRFVIILFLALFVVSALLYVMNRRKSKQQYKEQRLNELYAKALADYDRLKVKMEEQQRYSSMQMEELQAEADKLKGIIGNIQGSSHQLDAWDSESTVIYSEAVRSLHSYAQRGIAPDSLWNDVIELLRQYMPNFVSLFDKSSELNVLEKKISILIRLKFNPSEIQNLLEMKPQRLSNNRASINKKLFNDNSAKTLNAHIMQIKSKL